jgi:hypothetical protein
MVNVQATLALHKIGIYVFRMGAVLGAVADLSPKNQIPKKIQNRNVML